MTELDQAKDRIIAIAMIINQKAQSYYSNEQGVVFPCPGDGTGWSCKPKCRACKMRGELKDAIQAFEKIRDV